MFNNNVVYVVFRCPKCKGLGQKYPPGMYDAVSDKDIYQCADCGEKFMIRFTPLTRDAQQRNEAVDAGHTCPSCEGRGMRAYGDEPGLWHCYACKGTGQV